MKGWFHLVSVTSAGGAMREAYFLGMLVLTEHFLKLTAYLSTDADHVYLFLTTT